MKRVTGVGGIFFKAKDPKALYEWYRVHLGVESSPDAGAMWRDADHPEIPGFTLWRSEERRVGKECGDECRSRWSPYH